MSPGFVPGARPISRRNAESRRLAVSSTLPRLSRHPSMATAQPRELAHAPGEDRRGGELVADPRQPDVQVADGSQRLDRLGELFRPRARFSFALVARDGEYRAARRTEASSPSRVLRPSRSSEPAGHGSRRDRRSARSCAAACFPSEQAARAATSAADLVEVEKLERVRVHVPSRPRSPCPGRRRADKSFA